MKRYQKEMLIDALFLFLTIFIGSLILAGLFFYLIGVLG